MQEVEINNKHTATFRTKLLIEVLNFVGATKQISGVTRIALIGSLTTDKRKPKDADFLVTITEDADLKRLAKLGRKLSGHSLSFGGGGEVFLADTEGHYLGRTCPWKECRFGIRLSCDALNCGQRPYLHDDLQTVCLAEDIIAAPPIELWPKIKTRVEIPKDVEQFLLEPLRKDKHVQTKNVVQTSFSGQVAK